MQKYARKLATRRYRLKTSAGPLLNRTGRTIQDQSLLCEKNGHAHGPQIG